MINIGVSGHRDLPAETREVKESLGQIFERIRMDFPDRPYAIISPLAEGADRLVAWMGIDILSASLIVPLPLPLSEYLLDFETSASRQEFNSLLSQAEEVIELSPAGSRQAAYLAAGMVVLERSDLLIAIWDGLPARGTGGTAQIVARARELDRPLAWLQAARQDHPPDSPPVIHYERFPSPGSIEGEA